MQNRILSSDKGMDAIDALVCLGFKFCRLANGTFILTAPAFKCFDHAVNMASVSLAKEVDENIPHHNLLIQQKGLAYGN